MCSCACVVHALCVVLCAEFRVVCCVIVVCRVVCVVCLCPDVCMHSCVCAHVSVCLLVCITCIVMCVLSCVLCAVKGMSVCCVSRNRAYLFLSMISFSSFSSIEMSI